MLGSRMHYAGRAQYTSTSSPLSSRPLQARVNAWRQTFSIPGRYCFPAVAVRPTGYKAPWRFSVRASCPPPFQRSVRLAILGWAAYSAKHSGIALKTTMLGLRKRKHTFCACPMRQYCASASSWQQPSPTLPAQAVTSPWRLPAGYSATAQALSNCSTWRSLVGR